MTFGVLVVCVGNISRSPLAERLLGMRLRQLLLDQADEVAVTSAGVLAEHGNPIEPAAAAELVRLGGSPDGFVSRRIRPEWVREADLVLTANLAIRSRVLQEVPDALRRAFTLLEFAALVAHAFNGPPPADLHAIVARAVRDRPLVRVDRYDLVDPFRRSARIHRQVADAIDGATRAVAEAFVRSLGSAHL